MPKRFFSPVRHVRNSTLRLNAASVAFADPVQTLAYLPDSATYSLACNPASATSATSGVSAGSGCPPDSLTIAGSSAPVGSTCASGFMQYTRLNCARCAGASDCSASMREINTLSLPSSARRLRQLVDKNGDITNIRSTRPSNGQLAVPSSPSGKNPTS